jgi:hypothetical protein
LSWWTSSRWTKAVASGSTRLYAPPHGMKSSSRDSPAARPRKKLSTSAAMASAGRRTLHDRTRRRESVTHR